jgi:hypothetical protein
MKTFLKNFLLFLLPITIVLILSFIIIVYANNHSNTYKIESNISSIYIGDSHIQYAINDSLISGSLNLAQSAESFYFSYYKIKNILNHNPSIETVYLGLSYHNLSIYYDRFIDGEYSADVAPNYFYLLPLKEQMRMINWKRNNIFPVISRITKNGLNSILNNNTYPYIGRFTNQFDNTIAINSSMDKRILFQYYTNDELNVFSKLNIDYLDKIINLCRSKGVELITLNTPLHNYYNKRIPPIYKEKLIDIINSKDLNNIDLSNFKLSDDCFIPDGDHVSKIGANKTTIRLKEQKHDHTTKTINNAGSSNNLSD